VIKVSRLTNKINDLYIVDESNVKLETNGYSGNAIIKLAKFESFYDDLIAEQNQISKQLEELRLEGKTHSVKFKQLLANKMTNTNILILLKKYEL